MGAPADEPLGEERRSQREHDPDPADQPGQAREQITAELPSGCHDDVQLRIAERNRVGRVPAPEVGIDDARCEQLLRIRARTQVDRVVEIGERGIGVDVGPPVRGERSLRVDDVLRAWAPTEAVAESALRRAEQIQHHDGLRRARPAEVARDLGRGSARQLGRDADGDQRPRIGGADSPQRRGDERPSGRVRRHEVPERLAIAVGRPGERGRRRERGLGVRDGGGHDRGCLVDPLVQQAVLVARVHRARRERENGGDQESDREHDRGDAVEREAGHRRRERTGVQLIRRTFDGCGVAAPSRAVHDIGSDHPTPTRPPDANRRQA